MNDSTTDVSNTIALDWLAQAEGRAERLEQHLRAVLEICWTWQPEYASPMDRQTIAIAAEAARDRSLPTRTTDRQRPLAPVTQAWTHRISMMQQSVLLAAVRGPDGLAKYGGGAKMLLRWYRRCILLSAMDGRVLADPIEPNGGSFTGPSLQGNDDLDPWEDRMQEHVNDYLRQVDALPHHYQLHFMHAVEILGYKHPDARIRLFWYQLYLRLVNDLHLHPESELELDERLGDTREGWLKRADPATVA